MTNIFCEAAAEWDHDWNENDVCRECGLTAFAEEGSVRVVDEVEYAWYQGQRYPVSCGHWGERYPQVDSYKACVNDDYALTLICDKCNEEGAQDI